MFCISQKESDIYEYICVTSVSFLKLQKSDHFYELLISIKFNAALEQETAINNFAFNLSLILHVMITLLYAIHVMQMWHRRNQIVRVK